MTLALAQQSDLDLISALLKLSAKDKLTTQLEETLYQPRNFQFVEKLFLEELGLQRDAKSKNVQYATSQPSREDVIQYLGPAFTEILGLQMPVQGILIGDLGRLEATLFDTPHALLEHASDMAQIMNPYEMSSEQMLSYGVATAITFAARMVGRFKEQTDSYNKLTQRTFVDQPTLQEALITHAHERHHKLMMDDDEGNYFTRLAKALTESGKSDIRQNQIICEGGARDFQVRVNEYLAQVTGNESFRYANRWMVLLDIAPLYFEFCRRFNTKPVITNSEFESEAREYVPKQFRDLVGARLTNPTNHYAKGYALFRLAESRGVNPKILHKEIYNQNPTLLVN